MRNVVLTVIACLICTANVMAQEGQFRLLVHPTKKLYGNWGITGWGVTNLNPNGGNFVLMGGVRYENEKIWSEFMPCAVFSSGWRKLCFDTRTNVKLSRLTNLWFETQEFSDRFYWFLESNYNARRWLAGVETENIHLRGSDSLGIGGHVKFKIMNGVWTGPGYQFRKGGPDVLRLYVVVHLPR